MFRSIAADSSFALSFFAADNSLATTKAFTHGRLIFDQNAGTLAVAKMPPLPIPTKLDLKAGSELQMRLIAPDGMVKPQKRSGVLVEGARGVLRIPGHSRTPSSRTAEEGWGYTCRRYRAYLTHPGVPGSSSLPTWLTGSISRQRQLWNRIAVLCREAMRQCCDTKPEDTRAFIDSTILPAIDRFNAAQGRGRKMKYPAELRTEEPSLAAVRRFIHVLNLRARKGLPVPENLESVVTTWAQQHATNYTPIKTFEKQLDLLIKREAEALQLRFWERRAVGNALIAMFARRRDNKLSYAKGWPRYIDSRDRRAESWGIHYYLNRAAVPGTAVFDGGVRSLRLDEPLSPDQTGHPNARGKRFGLRRQFRSAEIAIPDKASGEVWRLAFSIVQHQPIPEESFLKEWKLIYSHNKLELILLLQARKPLARPTTGREGVAGMDLGWRRDGCGIIVATIFNSVRKTYTTIFVDLENRAPDTVLRTPFLIYMGPSRRGIRAAMVDARNDEPGYLDTFEGCVQLREARDAAKDRLKSQMRSLLGDAAPNWIEKAGFRRMRWLLSEVPEGVPRQLVEKWNQQDNQLASRYCEYSERVRARLRKGYERVAHDAGRMLQADGIHTLAIEDHFLAKAKQNPPENAHVALRRGAHYRQWVAPGMLVRALEQILPSYGIRIMRRLATNTTRQCHRCRTLNQVGAALHFQCRGCGAVLNQDHNAAVNLAAGRDQGGGNADAS